MPPAIQSGRLAFSTADSHDARPLTEVYAVYREPPELALCRTGRTDFLIVLRAVGFTKWLSDS